MAIGLCFLHEPASSYIYTLYTLTLFFFFYGHKKHGVCTKQQMRVVAEYRESCRVFIQMYKFILRVNLIQLIANTQTLLSLFILDVLALLCVVCDVLAS